MDDDGPSPASLIGADEFVVVRDFAASPAALFAAWTEPGVLARWWGPRSFTTPMFDMDVRSGGSYSLVMRAPDGANYPIKGRFREVAPPERLVMTLDVSEHPGEWHDLVDPGRDRALPKPAYLAVLTASFEPARAGSRLTVRLRHESTKVHDAMLRLGMREAWSQSLDRLAELVRPHG